MFFALSDWHQAIFRTNLFFLIPKCFEEELTAEFVGYMMSLNACLNSLRELVVGEAAHVKGICL